LIRINSMLFNNWVQNIERLKIDRPSKEVLKRLDCAERVSNYEPELFQSFIKNLSQEDLITYPSYAEYSNLESKIANYLKINKDQISLGTGSDSCIKDLMQVTLQKDSEVVSIAPCFPMYFIYSSGFNAKFTPIDYSEFKLNGFESFYECITSKTSLVIFTNPGSPFGYFKDSSEVEELAKYLCKKEIVLLIDEAYVEFAPGNCLELVKKYNNVVISRTFSKAWGAAGCRLGYLISQPQNIKFISKVKLTYPVNTIAVKFISFLLDNYLEVEKYIKDSIKERDILCSKLENSGYEVIRTHANTIHFHEINGNNSRTIEILNKHKVAFKAGSLKTGTAVRVPGDKRETWIRLSLGLGVISTDYMKEIIN